MTQRVIEAFMSCAIRTALIDFPTRCVVAYASELSSSGAVAYIGASMIAQFSTCFTISQVPYCDGDEFFCKAMQGATVYGARAIAREQDIIPRALVGVANKLAYNNTSGMQVAIETGEGLTVAFIKRLVGYEDVDFIGAVMLGFVVGVSLLECEYCTDLVLSYAKSYTVASHNNGIDNNDFCPIEFISFNETVVQGEAGSTNDEL